MTLRDQATRGAIDRAYVSADHLASSLRSLRASIRLDTAPGIEALDQQLSRLQEDARHLDATIARVREAMELPAIPVAEAVKRLGGDR
jgi:hypothetical protein